MIGTSTSPGSVLMEEDVQRTSIRRGAEKKGWLGRRSLGSEVRLPMVQEVSLKLSVTKLVVGLIGVYDNLSAGHHLHHR